jgi:hypothetical protein
MRRFICGSVFVLVLSGLTVGTSLAASASSAGTQKQVHTVKCTSAATGHKKLTKAGITACNSSTLKVTHPCPTGSGTIFVIVHKTTYALLSGHTPKRLPKQYGMGTITQVCGVSGAVTGSAAPATTATTAAPAPPPTTTTTTPPPPPTTAPAPPPPTTAAPASCHPLTDGGNCYAPGEYCRDSDHGMTGVAGNGETVTCEDNNGWRWEPT